MPPRPGPRHRGGGRHRGRYPVPYPYPYPGWNEGTTVVVSAPQDNCIVTDQLGRVRLVPCDLLAVGDDAVDSVNVIDDVTPRAPTPIIRQGIRIGAGRLNPGSTPYYNFAAQARSYPFDWHGRPGGVPSSRAAAESRELGLAGSGDLYESGLNPYTIHNPAMAHRGFTMPGKRPLSGFLDDLSTNEKRLLGLAAAGGLAYFLLQQMKRKRRGARAIFGRRRNPSPRRGRRRRRRTRRR